MNDDLQQNTVLPASDPGVTPATPPPTAGIAPGVEPTAQAVLGTPSPQVPISGGRRKEVPLEVTPENIVVNAPIPETQLPVVEQAPLVAETLTVQPELEKSAELGPELEKFVEQNEKQAHKQPEETVIASDSLPENMPKTVKKPVVVLPMTQKNLQDGQRKSPAMSMRWLAEWCVRQIKKFRSVLVVYRENE